MTSWQTADVASNTRHISRIVIFYLFRNYPLLSSFFSLCGLSPSWFTPPIIYVRETRREARSFQNWPVPNPAPNCCQKLGSWNDVARAPDDSSFSSAFWTLNFLGRGFTFPGSWAVIFSDSIFQESSAWSILTRALYRLVRWWECPQCSTSPTNSHSISWLSPDCHNKGAAEKNIQD